MVEAESRQCTHKAVSWCPAGVREKNGCAWAPQLVVEARWGVPPTRAKGHLSPLCMGAQSRLKAPKVPCESPQYDLRVCRKQCPMPLAKEIPMFSEFTHATLGSIRGVIYMSLVFILSGQTSIISPIREGKKTVSSSSILFNEAYKMGNKEFYLVIVFNPVSFSTCPGYLNP